MKNILIIGGSGFIGSHLIERLLDKDVKIINFDKVSSKKSSTKLTNVIGDVENISDFNNLPLDIDVLYVLAAVHKDKIEETKKYYDTNHTGAKNIINYSINANINKIIFFSSAAVYGNIFTSVTEEHDVNPQNHYGKSKYLAELELHKWSKKKEERILIIINC